MSKEPAEIVKILQAIFVTVMSAAVIGLTVTVISLMSDNAVLATKVDNLEKKIPEVTIALKEHTKAINELRVAIEGLRKNND